MKNYARKDFDYLRQQLLYRKIIKWNENEITLDNGTVLKIEETEQDCCASAGGSFKNVVLDAGNGGYYYSIASFLVYPAEESPRTIQFVSSTDE